MANTKLSDLSAASALTGSELFYSDDGSNDVKVTTDQIRDYITTEEHTIGNVVFTNNDITVGNSTVNAFTNSTALVVGDASNTMTITSTDLLFGNSTVNVYSNSSILKVEDATSSANLQAGTLTIGTSIVNTTTFASGTSVVNTTAVASGANVYLTTAALQVGNSTVNTFANSSLVKVENATDSANLAPATLTIGVSVVNTSAIVAGNSTVTTTIGHSPVVAGSNTFTLGDSNTSSDGWSFLFNGVLIQWGTVSANSSTGDVTFEVPFPNAIFSYQATSNASADQAWIEAANTTQLDVRREGATAKDTFWFAIGN